MRRVLIILLVLALAGTAWGATPLYVDPAKANNDGDGTSASTAKKTIDAAYLAVDDGGSVYLLAGTYDDTTQLNDWKIDFDQAKTVTIKPDPATSPAIILTMEYSYGSIYVNHASAVGIIEDVTIRHNTDTKRFIYFNAAGTLTCNNVIFDQNELDLDLLSGADAMLGCSITLTGCTYNNANGAGDPVTVKGGSLIIDDCTITHNTNSISAPFFDFRQLTGSVHNFTLTNSTISTVTDLFDMDAVSLVFGDFIIAGNTITQTSLVANETNYCIYIPDAHFDGLRITGNVIANTDAAVTGTEAWRAIQLGDGGLDAANNIRHPVIMDNTLSCALLKVSRGIYVDPQIFGAEISNNTITGFKFGLYHCGSMCNIHHNIIPSVNCISVFGGTSNLICNNTLVAADVAAEEGRSLVFGRVDVSARSTSTTYDATTVTFGGATDLSDVAIDRSMMVFVYATESALNPSHYGVVVGADDTGEVVTVAAWYVADGTSTIETPTNGKQCHVLRMGERNTLFNNILAAEDAHYTMTFDFNPRDCHNQIDYNWYTTGSSTFSNLGEATQTTFAQFLAKWATWSVCFPDNDSHSVADAPLLLNAAYAPQNAAMYSAGKPDIDGRGTYIGAIAPDLGGPVGSRQRYSGYKYGWRP